MLSLILIVFESTNQRGLFEIVGYTLGNVLLDIYDYFENSIEYKLKDKKIILDPGIGFGKTLKHNLTLKTKIPCFISLTLCTLKIWTPCDNKKSTEANVPPILSWLSYKPEI